MNNYQYPYYDNDERQFGIPGNLLGQFFGPGGGQSPGGSPFPGSPGGFPGGPGGFPGGGPIPGGPGGGQAGAPTSPPPNFTPQQTQQPQLLAVDPGGIRGCLFRFTYIWLRRDAFWFFPTFVGRNSIAGFRWTGFNWVYFGVDLDQVQSFQCY